MKKIDILSDCAAVGNTQAQHLRTHPTTGHEATERKEPWPHHLICEWSGGISCKQHTQLQNFDFKPTSRSKNELRTNFQIRLARQSIWNIFSQHNGGCGRGTWERTEGARPLHTDSTCVLGLTCVLGNYFQQRGRDLSPLYTGDPRKFRMRSAVKLWRGYKNSQLRFTVFARWHSRNSQPLAKTAPCSPHSMPSTAWWRKEAVLTSE